MKGDRYSSKRRSVLKGLGGTIGTGFVGSTEANSTEVNIAQETDSASISHGVTVGDVTSHSAIIWARASDSGALHVEYDTSPEFICPKRAEPVQVDAENDYTGKVRLSELQSYTRYYYRIWASEETSTASQPPQNAITGQFLTAPKKNEDVPVSFTWSADTYFGLDHTPPYQIPMSMQEFGPDFFMFLGDTVYADRKTAAVPNPPSDSLSDFRAKYKELKHDATNLNNFFQTTSVYTIWDDHEVTNDFAGCCEPLMPIGRQAFMEYWPIDEHPSVTGADPHRMYRSFRWGKNLELFILDTRQYRDKDSYPDGPTKTMLGEEQVRWLKRSVKNSNATFKAIVTTIPLITAGPAFGLDTWTDGQEEVWGFENELLDIVEYFQTQGIRNIIWLSADRHYAQVSALDPDEDGTPEFHDVQVGPIGAFVRIPGTKVGDTTLTPQVIDQTLNPTVLYDGRFSNFGRATVDNDSVEIRIHDETGSERYSTTIPTYDENAGKYRNPDAITDLVAKGDGNAISLSWEYPNNNGLVDYYEIYGSSNQGFELSEDTLIDVSVPTVYKHKNLNLEETWYYQVRAVHEGEEPGPASKTISGTTEAAIKLEGGALRPPVETSAPLTLQRMLQDFGEGWSNEAQALFKADEPEDYVTLGFNIPEDGSYTLSAVFTKGPQYGIHTLALDGTQVGSPFDAYNSETTPSSRIEFSKAQLTEGKHTITITVTGKNPKSEGYKVGIDFLQFESIKS